MKQKKDKKTIILIKQAYENLKCLENMFNCETFTLDTIPIYDNLFLEIYNSIKSINICLMSLKNCSLINELDKIKVDLNKLNYTIRTEIILIYLNECNNVNEQGLINFDNVFNQNNDPNYILNNDTSGCLNIDNYKKINILNELYLLVESEIVFDFTSTNIVFFKNKVDYIVETLIENINTGFKNIIKNIKINNKLDEIKEEKKILNNKYNNNNETNSIGEELSNILKKNDQKNNENKIKKTDDFEKIKNTISKSVMTDIFMNKKILKYFHYLLVIIIFRFLMKFIFFF